MQSSTIAPFILTHLSSRNSSSPTWSLPSAEISSSSDHVSQHLLRETFHPPLPIPKWLCFPFGLQIYFWSMKVLVMFPVLWVTLCILTARCWCTSHLETAFYLSLHSVEKLLTKMAIKTRWVGNTSSVRAHVFPQAHAPLPVHWNPSRLDWGLESLVDMSSFSCPLSFFCDLSEM